MYFHFSHLPTSRWRIDRWWILERRESLHKAHLWILVVAGMLMIPNIASADGDHSHPSLHDQTGHDQASSEVDARIAFYEQKLSEHPRLFAVYAELAHAYLDKARQEYGGAWLDLARETIHRSLEIQPNVPGFKAFAALHNYEHEFSSAKDWALRASEVDPSDTEAIALLVEAYLGLEQPHAAQALLNASAGGDVDFYLLAATAQWLSWQGLDTESAQAFSKAAEAARELSSTRHVAWAEVQATDALARSRRGGR